jgi:hypothetical protein
MKPGQIEFCARAQNLEKPGEMPACYTIVGSHHPINQYPPINIAAMAHVVIKPLYKNRVLEEK